MALNSTYRILLQKLCQKLSFIMLIKSYTVFDSMIVASSNKERMAITTHQNLSAGNCVVSPREPKKKYRNTRFDHEKTIYSKTLKFPPAVHLSIAEILICKLCAHGFGRCQGNCKFHVVLAKNLGLTKNFPKLTLKYILYMYYLS